MTEHSSRPKPDKLRWRVLLYALLLAGSGVLYWSLNRPEPPPSGSEYATGPKENLEWFQNAKFGVMIHWGPASLSGREMSWARQATRPGEEETGVGDVPVDLYDNLYRSFNPTQFDADVWAQLFRDAGARYVVFVTKHHDGFCMFDSRLTDYKITRTPYGRDLTTELTTAVRKAGLKVGFYYSQPDWRQPDYRTKTHLRYIPYLHGQVHELCLGYGPIDIFWFDGLNWRVQDWDAVRLFRMIRELQPHALINNRCALAGDYDVAEQQIGDAGTARAWETCLTMGTQWSYKPDDVLKPTSGLLDTLLRVVGAGGNLLLNTAPTPDGLIEGLQAARLLEIGRWLEQYGESVYGTRPGPFRPADWGVATHRDNRIYLHVLNPEARQLDLPDIGPKIKRSDLLTGGTASTCRTGGRLIIRLKPAPSSGPPWTIRLELNGLSPTLLAAAKNGK